MRVGPSPRPSDDYLRVNAPVEAFGGQIARGEAELGQGQKELGQSDEQLAQGQERFGAGLVQAGQGAFRAGQFYGQIVADNASNQFQDAANKILHGDPNQMVIGPDGQQHPDLGFLGLRGRAAMEVRPQVEAQLDQLRQEIADQLQTPEQQLQFDNFSRRYRAVISSQIGTHADTQSNMWMQSVNSTTATQALSAISANPTDPGSVAHAASDLIGARVKNAQLLGAQEGDPVWTEAVASAKRDALRAQTLAIGATDPAKAISIVQANREVAGADYEPLIQQFRSRADEQTGIALGSRALTDAKAKYPYANPALPIFAQTAQAIPGGYSSARGLSRSITLESSGDPNATNGHMKGLAQASDATWKQYGVGDPFNPADAIAFAQRYAAANRPVLQSALGRPPTDAELYLAHQQGPGGAVALLTHPTMRAGDLVGDRAIAANGGDPNAPASAFTGMWVGRFNGAPWAPPGGVQMPAQATGAPQQTTEAQYEPAFQAPGGAQAQVPQAFQPLNAQPNEQLPFYRTSPQLPKADAYTTIMNSGASPQVIQHALTYVSRAQAAQEIAEGADAKARKSANDQAAGEYVPAMLTGQTQGLLQKIAADPRLTWETKRSLGDALLHTAAGEEESAVRSYGQGFWQAFKAVTSSSDDPAHISDVNSILQRAAPGGDLTLTGAQKLIQVMNENQRSVNDQAVNQARVSLISYAKSQLSFAEDTGPVKIRDPKGEAIFNAQFIPKFEAAFDTWVRAGKNPWEFLTQENVDKMIKGMRPKAQMAQDKLAALGEAPSAPAAPIPPAPANVDQGAWGKIMGQSFNTTNGAPFPKEAFAQALSMLVAQPTPENIRLFDQSKFGRAGFRGAEILHQLRLPQ